MPTTLHPAKSPSKLAAPPHVSDCLGLWAASVATCATVLAAFVHFVADDAIGAAMTLLAVADHSDDALREHASVRGELRDLAL
jgi:hypothetical protein